MPKNLMRSPRGVIVENQPLVVSEITAGEVSIETLDAVIPAFGEVVGTSITGSYQTLIAPGGDARLVLLINTCDQDIIISFDAGTTDHVKLLANVSVALDLAVNGMVINEADYEVKHAGAAPTTGSITCSVFRY